MRNVRSFRQMRHLGLLASSMVIASFGLVGVVATAAPAGATKTPVAATGPMACGAWTGKATFNPPLLDGAAGMSTVTFSGQLSGCGGSVPAITSGKVTGTFTVPTDCTEAASSSGVLGGSGSYSIKWTGNGKIAETQVTTGAGSSVLEVSPPLEFGFGYDPADTLVGSFASNNLGVTYLVTRDLAFSVPPQTSCTPKTKGERGTGGLKKLTFSGDSIGFDTQPPPPVTVTFNYNGTDGTDGSSQTWTVPAGVTSIQVAAYGAQGGCDSNGGQGGEASGTLSVTPGQRLVIYVGGSPQSTDAPAPYGVGGYNGGGGTSFPDQGNGRCGGGGASDVRVAPYGLANRVIVGGGGGGTGEYLVEEPGGSWTEECGGAGGYPNGTASSCFAGGTSAPGDGQGGTASSGGAGGEGNGGAGALGTGGSGGDSSGDPEPGSGGGGGYYGGGGGGYATSTIVVYGEFFSVVNAGAGGGGSSFFVGGCTTTACPSGVQPGNGLVTITYVP